MPAKGLQNGVFSGSSCKIEISQELYSAAAHAGGTARIHSEKRHCNPVDAANKSQHDGWQSKPFQMCVALRIEHRIHGEKDL